MQQNISNDCCNVEGVPQTLNQTYLMVDAIKYLNSSLKPSMQFYPYFLKSSTSSKSSCLVFWFIYTRLMAMPDKLYLRCYESLFFRIEWRSDVVTARDRIQRLKRSSWLWNSEPPVIKYIPNLEACLLPAPVYMTRRH